MVLDALIRVKNIIEAKGWVQGYYVSPDGICLSEAVHRVTTYGNIVFSRVSDEILKEANKNLPPHLYFFSLIDFNDHRDTTKEKVLAAINSAIVENTP